MREGMRKALDIGITVCMLVLAVGLWILGGKNYFVIKAGTKPLSAEESFADAEGRYLSYEAAYPAGRYVEEYYKDDKEYFTKAGYALYDESRQAFLYVVVEAEDADDLERLMRNLGYPAESRKGLVEPVPVEGILTPMDETMIKHAKEAVKDRIKDLEDRTTDAPVETWNNIIKNQKDWYMIEHKMLGGVSKGSIRLCALAALCSLFIFVCRLIGSLTGEGKQEEAMEDGSAGMNQFLTRQSVWIKEWCQYGYNRAKTMSYRWLVGCVVFFVGIGVLARVGLQTVLVLHLPLGVLFGEAMLGIFWLSMRSRKKWKKVLRGIKKSIQEQFPTSEEQEAYFADYFEAESGCVMEERCKDSLKQIILGEKYWTLLSHYGYAKIVEVEKIDHIETVEEISSIRINKVRTYSYSYLAEFVYKEDEKNKGLHSYHFESANTLNSFVQLVRSCTDCTIAVENMGTRRI